MTSKEEVEEEEEDWERARIVFGNLTEINRAQVYATVEYKNPNEPDDWKTEEFSLAVLDPTQTKNLLEVLGVDAYFTIIDGAITNVRRA